MDTINQVDAYYHKRRDEFTEELRVKIHRSVSWLKKSRTLQNEPDLMLVTLWISFNALYGKIEDRAESIGERGGINSFLCSVCSHDDKKTIYSLLWKVYSGPVRNLLKNEYTYAPFWNYYNGDESYSDWKERLEKCISKAKSALAGDDTFTMLCIILDRIYTLRNQLVHGGATYGSAVNRHQVKESLQIMKELVPAILMIMIDNHEAFACGTPYYQYVRDGINKYNL